MGDGVLETFMRIGNESVVADATEHKRLVLRGRNASFDARPSDELFENFSFERLRGRFYAWNNVGFDSRFSYWAARCMWICTTTAWLSILPAPCPKAISFRI